MFIVEVHGWIINKLKEVNIAMSKKIKINKQVLIYVLILILFSSSIIMYNLAIQDIRIYHEQSEKVIKEKEFDALWLMIGDTRRLATMYVSDVSTKIQEDVADKCDMTELKRSLEKNEPYHVFENILRENVQGQYFSRIHNGSNDIFVATYKGILADYSHDNAGNYETASWESIISTHYNPKLAEAAIKKILTQSTDLIVWERLPNFNKNHIKYDCMDKDTFKEVYMREGLEGFRSYEFLIPTYITQHGDIFGNHDSSVGENITTNKIIVIQQFNIYDLFMEYYPDNASEFMNQDSDIYYINIMSNLHLLAIFLSLAVIGVMILTSFAINKAIDDLEDEENK